MFGRNPEQPPQGPPPDEQGQQVNLNDLPKPRMRTFRVQHEDEFGNQIETLVNAHVLAIAEDNRTVFQTYVVDEVLSMINRLPFQLQVTRVMTGVIGVEDVTPAGEPSRIIH